MLCESKHINVASSQVVAKVDQAKFLPLVNQLPKPALQDTAGLSNAKPKKGVVLRRTYAPPHVCGGGGAK